MIQTMAQLTVSLSPRDLVTCGLSQTGPGDSDFPTVCMYDPEVGHLANTLF